MVMLVEMVVYFDPNNLTERRTFKENVYRKVLYQIINHNYNEEKFKDHLKWKDIDLFSHKFFIVVAEGSLTHNFSLLTVIWWTAFIIMYLLQSLLVI